MSEPDYKQILINLCAGASLADHMGDMCGDIYEALKQADIITKEQEMDFDDLHDLANFLASKYKAHTVWGTEFSEDDD